MNQDYVLITPARDEAVFLPGLLESILSQTIRPLRWIIVSDGSTDRTDELSIEAASAHPFITFRSSKDNGKRGFGSKALAFAQGYSLLNDLDYSFIGNLDADVTFQPDYYERLLVKMYQNPRLGIASGLCWDKKESGFKCVTISSNHAVGAVQFFRKDCFKAIGGYRPVSVGGVDSLAERMARMHGWETKSFADLKVYHHKPVDSSNGRSAIRIAFRAGLTEYHIGTSPLFAIAKALRRWEERPLVVSMAIRLYGYFSLWVRRAKRDAPYDLVSYLKKEQYAAIRSWLFQPHGRKLKPI